MMFKPEDIHVILIGNDRTLDYRINLEILRYNFSFGDKLWITTVYNGNEDELPSGIGENTFIRINENRGYGLGALDAINEGLAFAASGYRPIVALFNFDVWFVEENGFKLWVEEFLETDYDMGAGLLPEHILPMTDCMIFRKEYLEKLLPIKNEVDQVRKGYEIFQKMYEGTELGFENMEEWMINAYFKAQDVYTTPDGEQHNSNDWWHFQRDGAPRYRWVEKFKMCHEHYYNIKRELLNKYNTTKGKVIPEFLGSKGA
jgi:hypothetical protein